MKNAYRVFLFGFIISSLFVFSPSFAKDTPNQPLNVPSIPANPPSDDCYWPSKVRLFAGGATHGRGIFYIDYLLPLYYSEDRDSLLFFNPKEHLESPFAEETNLGLGFRKIFNDDFILGVNYFYDKNYSINDKLYSQNGWGFELLSQPIDLRFNYYNPTTGAKAIGDPTYEFGPASLLEKNNMEEPLEGFDFEFGGPVFERYTKTRAYIGGFFYNSKLSKDIRGLRVRTETNLNNWLAIDNTLERSNNGKLDITSGVRVTIPFEWGRVRTGGNPLKAAPVTPYIQDRIFERVVRDLDVRASSSTQTSKLHDLTYVDNSNTNPSPDGTLTNPYTSIEYAINNAIGDKWIFVNTGLSQDTIPTYYSGGLTLPNDMVLWGAGYNGGFRGITVNGAYPVINGGKDVITIRNNNTVMGLQIQNGTNDGIKHTEGTTLSGSIKYNKILTNDNAGIDLTYNSGSMSDFTISNNTINGNGYIAIDLTYNSGSMSGFTISNNTIKDNEYAGIGLLNYGSGSMSGFTISNNTVTDNWYAGIGFYNYNSGSMSDFTISNNTVKDNWYDGIGFYNDDSGSMSGFTISNNTVNGNWSTGISSYGYGYGSMSGFTISNNTVKDNWYDGIGFYSNEFSTVSAAVISGNTIDNNDYNGIDFYSLDSGTVSAVISGNTIGNNGGSGGIYSSSNDTSSTSLTILGNTITNNDGEGVQLWANDTTTYSLIATGNTISGNYYIGLDVGTSGAGTFSATISGNSILNNGRGATYDSYGVCFNAGTGGAVSVSFSYNTVSGSLPTGISIGDFYDTGTFNIDLGGGSLGSVGQNSIYGSTTYDVKNITSATISAKNNWWGQASPETGKLYGLTAADYTPWLTSDPN
ncbi:MAG: right-handed parallel beta-helix repeat-containing protein [Candidatus Omnitrophota bacterium]